jgi:hypothetical protein
MTDANKSYNLTFEIRPKYLFARVASKTITPQMVVSYLHEITEKCQKMGRNRLMIERDIPATISDGDVLFTGTEFAHMGLENIRIAFVDAREENKENLGFAMMVVNNRGADLELFSNVADAEKWLLRA